MQDQRRESVRTPWGGIIAVAIGLLILGVVLLTPVKGWLNRIPNLWRIFYPLMALFAGYLVVSAFREDEGQLKALAVGKWAVLLAAALSASVYAYGGPRLFFSLGRWGAVLFIVAEVAHTVGETFSRGDVADGNPAGEP